MASKFIINTTINNKNIVYNELKVKHLKILLKCLAGDSPDPSLLFNNLDNILSEITNLTTDEIKSLNFLEYFILLLQIRSISMGGIIFAETNTDTPIKLQINIEKIVKILEEVDNNILKIETVQDFIIRYKLPTINEIIKLNNNTIGSYDSLFLYGFFYRNNHINFKDLTNDEQKTILDNLPAKISQTIFKNTKETINIFNSVNLLSYLPQTENINLQFNFNIQNLILLIELLFEMSLISLYENYLVLCKMSNLTPEFIEESTPGEYILYVKKLQELTSNKTQQKNVLVNNLGQTPFNDTGTRSEFTP
jgi:hypothetical protein